MGIQKYEQWKEQMKLGMLQDGINHLLLHVLALMEHWHVLEKTLEIKSKSLLQQTSKVMLNWIHLINLLKLKILFKELKWNVLDMI